MQLLYLSLKTKEQKAVILVKIESLEQGFYDYSQIFSFANNFLNWRSRNQHSCLHGTIDTVKVCFALLLQFNQRSYSKRSIN